MIYADITLPIPDGALLAGSKYGYVYLKLGASRRDENHKLKHNVLLIGKKAADDTGFHPNDNYYTHFNLDRPQGGRRLKRGRRPKDRETSLVIAAMNDERLVSAYDIVCRTLLQKTSLLNDLEFVFGECLANRTIALASYFICNNTSSCSEFDIFSRQHTFLAGDCTTVEEASATFDKLSPENRDLFFQKWTAHNGPGPRILYDIPSRTDFGGFRNSTISFNLTLYVSKHTGLPLCYRIKYENICECQHLQDALRDTETTGLDKKVTIVSDVQSIERISKIKECYFITNIPLLKYSDVDERIIQWRKDYQHLLDFNSPLSKHLFELSEEQFTLFGRNGRLAMYFSPYMKTGDDMAVFNTIKQLMRRGKDGDIFQTHEPWDTVSPFCACREINENGKTVYEYKIDQDRLNYTTRTNGCLALFTTDPDMSGLELLRTQQYRSMCERVFTNVDYEVSDIPYVPLRDTTLSGKLFVLFISLVLRKELASLFDKTAKDVWTSPEHRVRSLAQLRCLRHGDRVFLPKGADEEQRRIFASLDIPFAIADQ